MLAGATPLARAHPDGGSAFFTFPGPVAIGAATAMARAAVSTTASRRPPCDLRMSSPCVSHEPVHTCEVVVHLLRDRVDLAQCPGPPHDPRRALHDRRRVQRLLGRGPDRD